MAEVLGDEGFNIAAFSCGDEICTQLRRGLRPALIIVDIIMPGTNGIDLVLGMRGDGIDIPIIFTTGMAPFVFEAIRRLGPGTLLLPKPFSVDDLIRYVRSVIPTQRQDGSAGDLPLT
jgi:FixJ family two-component response regulator